MNLCTIILQLRCTEETLVTTCSHRGAETQKGDWIVQLRSKIRKYTPVYLNAPMMVLMSEGTVVFIVDHFRKIFRVLLIILANWLIRWAVLTWRQGVVSFPLQKRKFKKTLRNHQIYIKMQNIVIVSFSLFFSST